MTVINGKVLVFTDLHIGLKNAQKSRLDICEKVVSIICDYLSKNNIKTVLFLGDWNHNRVSTDNNALNVSHKLMHMLAEKAIVYMVVGNHDIYMKNSVDINSLVMFKDIENVNIVDKTMQVKLNGCDCLLVPWLGDLSSFKKETQDMLFGHFDINSKFLIQTYVAQNICKKIDSGLADDIESQFAVETQKANDSVGSFVDIVKLNGRVFAGHIHTHKEFFSKGRWVSFVGSPYQQNLGEVGSECGFYVIDEHNNAEFIHIDDAPKHIEVYASQLLDNNFDFSSLKGNIVHKIYDVELSIEDDAKISQKINDSKPYEELMPEYAVPIQDNATYDLDADEQSKLIQKSKLEYIRRYVHRIDPAVLQENNIDVNKLLSLLEAHYNVAIGEK